MGFTHYLSDCTKPTAKQWVELVTFAEFLFKQAKADGIKLGNGCGEKDPEITENYIAFNGNAETGQDHESGYFSKTPESFEFCKTARKEYDPYVVAFYKKIDSMGLGNFSSDGEDYELKEGVHIFRILG